MFSISPLYLFSPRYFQSNMRFVLFFSNHHILILFLFYTVSHPFFGKTVLDFYIAFTVNFSPAHLDTQKTTHINVFTYY